MKIFNDLENRALPIFSLLVFFIGLSLFLAGNNFRTIPGGPFLYFHSDILPFFTWMVIIVDSSIHKKYTKSQRIISGILCLIMVYIWTLSLIGSYAFYCDKHARGIFLKW